MKTRAVVSDKGQVTIPKRLRDQLGIRPGTQLLFQARDGSLLATRLLPGDPLDRLVGAGQGHDADAALDEMRGPAWSPASDGGPA